MSAPETTTDRGALIVMTGLGVVAALGIAVAAFFAGTTHAARLSNTMYVAGCCACAAPHAAATPSAPVAQETPPRPAPAALTAPVAVAAPLPMPVHAGIDAAPLAPLALDVAPMFTPDVAPARAYITAPPCGAGCAPVAVAEPGSAGLMLLGVGAVAVLRRRAVHIDKGV